MVRALLTGLLVLGGTAAAQAQGGATAFFSETVKDFGATPRGPILVHYFTLKNTTNAPLNLGQPRVSCGCVSASIVNNKTVVPPGDTAVISAQMDTRRIPQANVLKSVIVYVPIVSPFLEEVQLRVQAVAREDLVLTPDTLSMGTVRKGQEGKASVRLTCYSDANWKVGEPTCTGAYVKTQVTQVARQGNEVTYEVTATLDPTCPVGNWTADVWVKTSAPGLDKLRIPLTVNVVSPIAVNPGAISFGDVKIGEPAEQKVILQGSAPFKIVGVKGGEGVIAVDDTAAGARPVHVLKLTLTPKSIGEVARSLEIVTDSKEQPKVVVPVTARALGK